MLNRRGIMGLVLGAGGAAAAGLKPKDVLGAAGVPRGPRGWGPEVDGPETWPLSVASQAGPSSVYASPFYEQRRELQRALERSRNERSGHIPAHIDTKRSWSVAFKLSEAAREDREYRAAMAALEDDALVERLARALLGAAS